MNNSTLSLTEWGGALREARQARAWSLFKLFQGCGLSVATLAEFERGVRRPEPAQFLALKAALGTPSPGQIEFPALPACDVPLLDPAQAESPSQPDLENLARMVWRGRAPQGAAQLNALWHLLRET